MRTSTALEGVYQWNQLLSSARPDLTLKGIVVNYEEHAGFEAHLPRIPEFRKIYSPRVNPFVSVPPWVSTIRSVRPLFLRTSTMCILKCMILTSKTPNPRSLCNKEPAD
jgi:hypothetical protein